jgi:hypothetical protein
MDAEAFVSWALDDARNTEERYTTELLCERGVSWWRSRRNIYRRETLDDIMARNRERKLNPAYEPHYTEDDLRKTAEVFADLKDWYMHSDRPVRDVSALAFFPSIESVNIHVCCYLSDVSPFAKLPRLRSLHLGAPGSNFHHFMCRDFTPLARCSALRHLALGFDARWPDFTGLDSLTQLEVLTLSGNLLALPRGMSFPGVRVCTFHCQPLGARNVADLPQLPDCEFLTLSGVDQLDGIEKMPLRNLTILGPFESFQPLLALHRLTCLAVRPQIHSDPEHMPRDVSPLVHLPSLRCLEFGHMHCEMDLPRDYSPLTDAPALRELTVKHCPPVQLEVATINAALPPCDDLFAPCEPKPLPPLRMIIGPPAKHPTAPTEHRDPDETGLLDLGLRAHEERWITAWLQHFISSRLGHSDWGKATGTAISRCLALEIHSFDCVGKLPRILDFAREAMTRLRPGYDHASLSIYLRVPPPEDTPAMKALEEKFERERDEWESEQTERDRREYLERLHQLELKKQEGAEIVPEEFSPTEKGESPIPPWREPEEADDEDGEFDPDDDDDDEGDEGDEGDGDVGVKEKPRIPASWLDDEHPLADQYRLSARFTLEEVWFPNHFRTLAIQLMGREPDEEFPEEKTE